MADKPDPAALAAAAAVAAAAAAEVAAAAAAAEAAATQTEPVTDFKQPELRKHLELPKGLTLGEAQAFKTAFNAKAEEEFKKAHPGKVFVKKEFAESVKEDQENAQREFEVARLKALAYGISRTDGVAGGPLASVSVETKSYDAKGKIDKKGKPRATAVLIGSFGSAEQAVLAIDDLSKKLGDRKLGEREGVGAVEVEWDSVNNKPRTRPLTYKDETGKDVTVEVPKLTVREKNGGSPTEVSFVPEEFKDPETGEKRFRIRLNNTPAAGMLADKVNAEGKLTGVSQADLKRMQEERIAQQKREEEAAKERMRKAREDVAAENQERAKKSMALGSLLSGSGVSLEPKTMTTYIASGTDMSTMQVAYDFSVSGVKTTGASRSYYEEKSAAEELHAKMRAKGIPEHLLPKNTEERTEYYFAPIDENNKDGPQKLVLNKAYFDRVGVELKGIQQRVAEGKPQGPVETKIYDIQRKEAFATIDRSMLSLMGVPLGTANAGTPLEAKLLDPMMPVLFVEGNKDKEKQIADFRTGVLKEFNRKLTTGTDAEKATAAKVLLAPEDLDIVVHTDKDGNKQYGVRLSQDYLDRVRNGNADTKERREKLSTFVASAVPPAVGAKPVDVKVTIIDPPVYNPGAYVSDYTTGVTPSNESRMAKLASYLSAGTKITEDKNGNLVATLTGAGGLDTYARLGNDIDKGGVKPRGMISYSESVEDSKLIHTITFRKENVDSVLGALDTNAKSVAAQKKAEADRVANEEAKEKEEEKARRARVAKMPVKTSAHAGTHHTVTHTHTPDPLAERKEEANAKKNRDTEWRRQNTETRKLEAELNALRESWKTKKDADGNPLDGTALKVLSGVIKEKDKVFTQHSVALHNYERHKGHYVPTNTVITPHGSFEIPAGPVGGALGAAAKEGRSIFAAGAGTTVIDPTRTAVLGVGRPTTPGPDPKLGGPKQHI